MGSPEPSKKSVGLSREEFDAFQNRIAVGLAKRQALVDSWFVAAGVQPPRKKTDEELEAEDAALFRNEPPYLGLGAEVPSHWLVSEAQNNNKSLRAKFFPTKGLKGSKARDAEEKTASAKRGLRVESSDEEEGRSGLGRAKKLKMSKRPESAEMTSKIEVGVNLAGNQSAEGPSIATTFRGKKSKREPVEDPAVEDPAVEGSETRIPAHYQSAHNHVRSTLNFGDQDTDEASGRVGKETIVDAGVDRKRAKEERKRERKRLRRELEQLPQSGSGKEYENSRCDSTEKMIVGEELDHRNSPTTTASLNHKDGSGYGTKTSKSDLEKPAQGVEQSTKPHDLISKEQKNKERKKRKREKKRLMEAAAKLNATSA